MERSWSIREITEGGARWVVVEDNLYSEKEAREAFREEVDCDPLRHLILVRETVLKEHLRPRVAQTTR